MCVCSCDQVSVLKHCESVYVCAREQVRGLKHYESVYVCACEQVHVIKHCESVYVLENKCVRVHVFRSQKADSSTIHLDF